MKGDVNAKFLIGTMRDPDTGQALVLLDFRGMPIDHLKLTADQALELAEALAETARDVIKDRGLVIATGHFPTN